MDALFHLRDMIASLDVPLVEQLCARSVLRQNEALYAPRQVPPALSELAAHYAESRTLPGRVQLLRTSYLYRLLPALCAPGNDTAERAACLAADAACLNSLARRLALSVHVATRKREALPESLQAAIRSGDPARIEEAITRPDVEGAVVERVARQARKRGADAQTVSHLAALYVEWIMPLSRKIQVHGLLAAPL